MNSQSALILLLYMLHHPRECCPLPGQMLHTVEQKKLRRSRVDDRQPQHHSDPRHHHRQFPILHSKIPQHDQLCHYHLLDEWYPDLYEWYDNTRVRKVCLILVLKVLLCLQQKYFICESRASDFKPLHIVMIGLTSPQLKLTYFCFISFR